MQKQFLYSTIIAGVLGFGTLGLFYNGAQALDLGDFTGADRKVITQDAPRAGGIVLIKEEIVRPNAANARIQGNTAVRANAPVLTAASYNNLAPAAGNTGGAGAPGKGIDGKVDVTTMPGNAFDQVRARFNTPGVAASEPVDGKPLTTDTLASGARVNTLNEIAPAAGGTANFGPVDASVSGESSLQTMTGRTGSFNN